MHEADKIPSPPPLVVSHRWSFMATFEYGRIDFTFHHTHTQLTDHTKTHPNLIVKHIKVSRTVYGIRKSHEFRVHQIHHVRLLFALKTQSKVALSFAIVQTFVRG